MDGTTDTTKEEAQKEGNKYVINQAQYNKLLNEKAKIFKEMGLEQQDAMANAKTYMSANYIVDSSAAGNAVKAADFSSASNGYTIVTIDKSDSSIETEESYTEIVIEEPEQKLEEELELEVA